jgi:hypothetical protein
MYFASKDQQEVGFMNAELGLTQLILFYRFATATRTPFKGNTIESLMA